MGAHRHGVVNNESVNSKRKKEHDRAASSHSKTFHLGELPSRAAAHGQPMTAGQQGRDFGEISLT